MTQFETRSAHWLSVPDAVDRVLSRARVLETEDVSLAESLGRALAGSVVAKATLPPWDNSGMDGYAVRGEDLSGATSESPVGLRVIGETWAGRTSGLSVSPGEAVRIMTGAPMPAKADTVIRVEDTDAEETPGLVRVFSERDRGRNIRPRGQDMTQGEEVLQVGMTVGAGQIGLLAGAGAHRIPVIRRPRVAILPNGDELAAPEDFSRVERGEAIPETNSPTLTAAVAASGGVPLPLGIVRDDRASILEGISRARTREADVVITSGGASMGERDLFKRVLDDVGFELEFWRVKMRPGTPFSFGFLPASGEHPPIAVFGLPGNPASCFVTFQVFCRPYLLRLAGHRRIHRPVVTARAGEPLRSPTGLTHFFRVLLRGDPASPEAVLTGSQTSGLVRGQGVAQGLAVAPEGVPLLKEGDPVRVILLDDFGLGTEDPGYFGA